MAVWTDDELHQIETQDEVRLAPVRRDGGLRAATIIWAVRAGDAVYVRAAYGAGTGWHRVARRGRAAHLALDGVDRDVVLEDVEAVDELDAVDAAYRSKYGRYASIVDGITDDEARATTLRLVPQS